MYLKESKILSTFKLSLENDFFLILEKLILISRQAQFQKLETTLKAWNGLTTLKI